MCQCVTVSIRLSSLGARVGKEGKAPRTSYRQLGMLTIAFHNDPEPGAVRHTDHRAILQGDLSVEKARRTVITRIVMTPHARRTRRVCVARLRLWWNGGRVVADELLLVRWHAVLSARAAAKTAPNVHNLKSRQEQWKALKRP